MKVLCFATIGLACAIGYGRGGREWTAGFAGHYSHLILPLYAGIFLLAIRLSTSKLAFIMFFLIAGVYSIYIPRSLDTSYDIRLRFERVDDALYRSLDIDSFVVSQASNLFFIDTKETRSYIRKGVSAMAHQSVQVHSEALNKFSKFAQ